jgi:PKD repeat protein
VSYAWALGNGQTATGAQPTVTYAAAGTYTVTLTVTDDDGATGTATATVTITAGGGGGGGSNQYELFVNGTLSGTTATIQFEVDLSTRNDPTDPAQDLLAALTFDDTIGGTATYTFSPFTDCTANAGWTIAGAGDGGLGAKNIRWSFVAVQGRTSPAGGRLVLGTCTFAGVSAGTLTVTGTTTNLVSAIKSGPGGPNLTQTPAAWRFAAAASVGSGGGAVNQAPVARAGGPYSGTVGQPVALNGSASSDADGTIVSYAWALGNGQTATGAQPTVTYAAAGTYTATLTVTDDDGATGTATATVTITAGGGGGAGSITLSNTFAPAAVNPGQVELTLTLDLTNDLPQTPQPEAISSFSIASLRWDPTVLRYASISFDSGSPISINTTDAVRGNLSFSGNVAASRSTGLVRLARVRFDAIGSAGSSTSTTTVVANIAGTSENGFFNYTGVTVVREGTYSRP